MTASVDCSCSVPAVSGGLEIAIIASACRPSRALLPAFFSSIYGNLLSVNAIKLKLIFNILFIKISTVFHI